MYSGPHCYQDQSTMGITHLLDFIYFPWHTVKVIHLQKPQILPLHNPDPSQFLHLLLRQLPALHPRPLIIQPPLQLKAILTDIPHRHPDTPMFLHIFHRMGICEGAWEYPDACGVCLRGWF